MTYNDPPSPRIYSDAVVLGTQDCDRSAIAHQRLSYIICLLDENGFRFFYVEYGFFVDNIDSQKFLLLVVVHLSLRMTQSEVRVRVFGRRVRYLLYQVDFAPNVSENMADAASNRSVTACEVPYMIRCSQRP